MSHYNNYDDEYYEDDDGYYDEGYGYDDGNDYGDTTQSKIVTKQQAKQTKQSLANKQTNKNNNPPKSSTTKSTIKNSKSSITTPLSSIKQPTTSASTSSTLSTSSITISQSLNNLSINNNNKVSPKKQTPEQRDKWYSDRLQLIESTYSRELHESNQLNIVVIGHVDAGKSTLMGHVLHLQGRVNDRLVQKYERESREQGKQSFSYAWILDSNDTERTRGVTTDIAINWFD